ncbi:MAG: hypothetical protein WCJ93_10365, partial [Methanomicrobiales archaeon]
TTAGQIPAMGSASAYVKSHIQEARGTTNNVKSEDVVYSEVSSASGRITAFNKVISYSSQYTGSPSSQYTGSPSSPPVSTG